MHPLMRKIDRAFGLVAGAALQLHLLSLGAALDEVPGNFPPLGTKFPHTSRETALHGLGRGPLVRTPPLPVACEATFLGSRPSRYVPNRVGLGLAPARENKGGSP